MAASKAYYRKHHMCATKRRKYKGKACLQHKGRKWHSGGPCHTFCLEQTLLQHLLSSCHGQHGRHLQDCYFTTGKGLCPDADGSIQTSRKNCPAKTVCVINGIHTNAREIMRTALLQLLQVAFVSNPGFQLDLGSITLKSFTIWACCRLSCLNLVQ